MNCSNDSPGERRVPRPHRQPDLVDKAVVLLVRLTKNHPLPDGNKRAAWLSMRMFVAVNGWTWHTRPCIDDAEATVLAIAAGELDEAGTAEWAPTVPRATPACCLRISAV